MVEIVDGGHPMMAWLPINIGKQGNDIIWALGHTIMDVHKIVTETL